MMNRVLDEHLKPYLAHVRRNEDGSFAIHGLEDHLRAVTTRPRQDGGSDSR
jgi:hypothetical protein